MLLDTSQTASLLRISPRTMEGWRLTGGGPVYTKAGRRVLYNRQQVMEWLQSQSRQSTSDVREVA